jgi:tetratricopeptide (TPR) repeat protein
VLILAASLGWIVGERQARRAESERRVEEALAVLETSLPRGNPHAPELVTAARQAEAQLANGLAGKELRQRVERMLADLAMLTRLEEIRLDQSSVKGGHFDIAGADSAYAGAFREYGIDVEALSVEETGTRIRERAIALHLAAALDDWALARETREKQGSLDGGQTTKEPAAWKRLLEVARVADPDPWRGSLREALANHKRGADLEKLATSTRLEDLPPQTLYMFGCVLRRAGAFSLAAEVLRQGQQRYPADFWIHHQLAFLLAYEMKPPQLDEGIGCYRAALALRPDSPGVYLNFGNALKDKGKLDQAIACFKEAIRLKEDYGGAYLNLGRALEDKGQPDGAIDCFRKVIGFKKDHCAEAHNNLGILLKDRGQLDEAIAEYREALRLKNDSAFAHNNLGVALRDKGRLDEAIAEYRTALSHQKDYPGAHYNLGTALDEKGQFDEAVAELQEAVRLRNDRAEYHGNLARTLEHRGQLDEAIAEYRIAIRLNKADADYHNDLGGLLHAQGDDDGAAAEWREAIRLKEHDPAAHCNLGRLLMDRGQFAEALSHLRRGHELSLKDPGRRETDPSAEWLKECASCLALESRLPAIISGKEQPADAGQRADYAHVCRMKHLYAAATRLYREAITAKPDLAASPVIGLRYNAACAAALAGCGAGDDADKLTHAERAALRKQALDWLRADLDAWRGLLDKDPDKARPAVAQQMRDWLGDADFNGVRGPDALAKLPEAERTDWQKLWADVTDTLAKAWDVTNPGQPRE